MLSPLIVRFKRDGKLVEVPHWFDKPESDWEAYESFQVFLAKVWEHLGLPALTRDQLEIAHRLQYGYDSEEAKLLSEEEKQRLYNEPREDIIRAYRGLGKSYITAAFAIWRVMRNPRDEKVLVVSATSSKAKEFVAQAKGIIASMSMLKWLLEGDRETGAPRRDTAEEFDVAGSSLSQSYSVAARGITGQITGSRATLLIADDIEIEKNSKTEEARARILNVVKSDFVPITETEFGKGDIIFLGTPQTEESVYNVLVTEMGFRCMCVPLTFPTAEKVKSYVLLTPGRVEVNILAPYLRGMFERGEITYEDPVSPTRFDRDKILKLKAKGLSTYLLQYMLDTSLSDAERYPLKLHDLIVFAVNVMKAPRTVQWGPDTDRKNLIKDIPNLGFSGDHLLRPLFVDTEWVDYDQLMIHVDPSGRGKDETSWCVLGQLNGLIYLIDLQGEIGDPHAAMKRIAMDALKYQVREIVIEPNFGQGAWQIALEPIVEKVYPGRCSIIESEWAKGQKETRIIDTLEPVLTAHRLIVNEAILREDAKRDERVYSFMYQLTHITRDRGALARDDRLDTVAGGVAHFMASMAADVGKAAAEQKIGEQQAMIDAFEDALDGVGHLWSGRWSVLDGVEREVWSKRFEWER
jgi:hypothetical protein